MCSHRETYLSRLNVFSGTRGGSAAKSSRHRLTSKARGEETRGENSYSVEVPAVLRKIVFRSCVRGIRGRGVTSTIRTKINEIDDENPSRTLHFTARRRLVVIARVIPRRRRRNTKRYVDLRQHVCNGGETDKAVNGNCGRFRVCA